MVDDGAGPACASPAWWCCWTPASTGCVLPQADHIVIGGGTYRSVRALGDHRARGARAPSTKISAWCHGQAHKHS